MFNILFCIIGLWSMVHSQDMQQCCTDWCRDSNRFNGQVYQSEQYYASDSTQQPSCSSSKCTCSVSASIATTWTIITGNICDTHNFHEGSCDDPVCSCPIVTISGVYNIDTNECICVGSSGNIIDKPIWSSTCIENVQYDAIFHCENPTRHPSLQPTKEPTDNPSQQPTEDPSLSPTLNPTIYFPTQTQTIMTMLKPNSVTQIIGFSSTTIYIMGGIIGVLLCCMIPLFIGVAVCCYMHHHNKSMQRKDVETSYNGKNHKKIELESSPSGVVSHELTDNYTISPPGLVNPSIEPPNLASMDTLNIEGFEKMDTLNSDGMYEEQRNDEIDTLQTTKGEYDDGKTAYICDV